MNQKKIVGFVAAFTLVILIALLAGYYSQQANVYESKTHDLRSYWNASANSPMVREAAYADKQRQRIVQGLSPQFNEASNIKVSIYLQVQERKNERQKIRVYVLSQNTSLVKRIEVNGPYVHVFEKWKESPTNVQIQGMIHSSKIQHFGGDGVLWPHQSHLIYTDFVFPYPMALDFRVGSSLTEDRGKVGREKNVTDSVLLRGSDLDALPVMQ